MTAPSFARLRTGIAVMGLGFVVAKVALFVQPTNEAVWIKISMPWLAS